MHHKVQAKWNLQEGGRSGLSKGLQFASTLFVSLHKQFLLEMGTIATLTPELPLLSGWCGCLRLKHSGSHWFGIAQTEAIGGGEGYVYGNGHNHTPIITSLVSLSLIIPMHRVPSHSFYIISCLKAWETGWNPRDIYIIFKWHFFSLCYNSIPGFVHH